MKENTVKVFIETDTAQIDIAQEKANELENTLKRVKELINSLNSK